VQVQPELAGLMRSVPGVDSVCAQGSSLSEYDYHCPLMSLPHHLHVALDETALHGGRPYLVASADEVGRWRTRLSGYAGLKVGLVWGGSSRLQSAQLAAIDARRSISLSDLAPVVAVAGCSFFSLQKGPASAELNASLPIHDFSGEWSDFADTAAFVANLDLVISVDTAVAHLAGGLGVAVWLLNRFDTCWRWLRGRDDSPWYGTLRQFRQPAPSDWAAPVGAAASALKGLVEGRGSG